jgi:flagellar motor switch/type III secretory pathway protein FliN
VAAYTFSSSIWFAMPLTPDLAPEILAACTAGAAEAGAALGRALDGEFALSPKDAVAASEAMPALAGSGLVLVLKVGHEAAIVAIPESSGLLPPWYAAPDATGVSKLTTLAQELGMLLLPESIFAEDFAALRASDLAAALARAGLDAAAGAIPLELAAGDKTATAWLMWPVPKSAALGDPPAPATAAPPLPPPVHAPGPAAVKGDLEDALPKLPTYTRSLLKIRVPIVVTLARTQQPLSRIVELAPGSIIPFDKSCDDSLSLEVNNREVAVGEAVKVGDKFGLRITSMLLPPESFQPLQGRRGA